MFFLAEKGKNSKKEKDFWGYPDPNSAASSLTPFLTQEMLNHMEKQTWPNLQLVDGLLEGRGVMATAKIPPGKIICNYGGELTNDEEWASQDKNFNMQITWQGISKFYAIHCMHTQETFGKFLNHSKKHPNVRTKIMVHPENGKPEVMFKTMRTVVKDEELCYDYGPKYPGLNDCLASCRKCSELKCFIAVCFML